MPLPSPRLRAKENLREEHQMQMGNAAKMDAEEEKKRAAMQKVLDRQVGIEIVPRRGIAVAYISCRGDGSTSSAQQRLRTLGSSAPAGIRPTLFSPCLCSAGRLAMAHIFDFFSHLVNASSLHSNIDIFIVGETNPTTIISFSDITRCTYRRRSTSACRRYTTGSRRKRTASRSEWTKSSG